jgi:ribosome-associated protein
LAVTFSGKPDNQQDHVAGRHILKNIESYSLKTLEFLLKNESVALCDLLKLSGLADSGGRGKVMVAEGLVKVDGKTESRKTAKIRAGQSVECMGMKIEVKAKES